MANGTATLELEDALPHELPGKRNQYSLIRAIRRAIELGGPESLGQLDGIELEVSQEIAKRSGVEPKGFFCPLSAPIPRFEARDLSSSSGVGAVKTTTDVTRLIDVLRSRSVCAALGARSPIVGAGNLRLPRRTATAGVSWVAEGASPPTQSNQIIEGVTATPKTMAAFTDVSRAMITSQPLTSSIVVEDLALAMAAEFDRVTLVGTGANDQPTGIKNTPAVPTIAIGANGGAPTFTLMCQLEQTLGEANADVGSLGVVTTAAARSKLRRVEKAAGSGMVWTDENRVVGMPAMATGSMPSNQTKGSGTALSALIMGNFADLMLPIWFGVDVVVNPFLFSSLGVVRVSAFMSCDVLVRRPASFVQVGDLVTV